MRVIVIEITLEQGLLTPDQLPELVRRVEEALPEGAFRGLVGLSGRLPVWAYGALIHHLHPAAAVGTYDPRLGGLVVVASHVPELKLGDVIGLEDAEVISVVL